MSTPEHDYESESETAPLNPAAINENLPDTTHDPELNGSLEAHEMNTPQKRDPMHILILYSLSCIVSLGGLACALAGYGITLTAPLDKENKKWHRMSYEENFWEMQSVVVLLAINVVFTALNFRIAFKGSDNNPDLRDVMVLFNMLYDFFMWAALIAFGVVNMIWMLWDRRLCDGWSDEEMYKKCDVAVFQLLVVEMIAVNLGILAAVFHFILLIGRCCTCGTRNSQARSQYLRQRIRQEEEVLMELMERRRQLVEETEELEARRGTRVERPVPNTPVEEAETADFIEGNVQSEEGQPPQYEEEDLIDMETRAVEGNAAAVADPEVVNVQ